MRMLPSAPLYQPSYAPVMLEPRSRMGLDSGNGLGVWPEPCCPARTRTPPIAANAISSANFRREHTLMRSVAGDVLPGARRDFCLELRVAEVRDVNPRVAHLVDGP